MLSRLSRLRQCVPQQSPHTMSSLFHVRRPPNPILDYPPEDLRPYRLEEENQSSAWTCICSHPAYCRMDWEMVRVRNYGRHNPPTPMDWTDDGFAGIFVLFMMNWISSTLWQYVIMYFLGTLTNDPIKGSHYAGGFRACLAAGESVVFGLDSLLIPYIKEAGIIFAFYFAGICIYAYFALFVIEETKYFQEENVVVPAHVLQETGHTDIIAGIDVGGESTPEEKSAVDNGSLTVTK